MENNVENSGGIGQNRLEQVYLNMPEVRFYFAGDREQTQENLRAYLGKEELALQSLQRFEEGEGNISYYVLLDVSASISESEFGRITEALAEFGQSLRPGDHMTFLTFGEEVTELFRSGGEELAAGEIPDLIRGLVNTDQRTLLFEAIQKAAEDAGNVPAAESTRRVLFVITDGEDIAKGMATREEALQTLRRNGIPAYGFTVSEAKRDAVNAFGEFSRATGGCLTILEPGAEGEGFSTVGEGILQSYEALFTAGSNQVSNEVVSAVLEFVREGEKQQADVMQDRWIEDGENPVVAQITQEGAKQIRVLFSEPVEGAESADNFRLEKEGQSLVPAYASVGSDGSTVVLTFSDSLESGEYTLVCNNVRDCSMERNPLEQKEKDGAGAVQIQGEEAGAEAESLAEVPESHGQEANFFQKYGWAAVLVLLILLAGAFWAGWRRLKKRQAIVTVEEKAVLKSNTGIRQHVLTQEKQWEEKELFFHVEGQREEIRVVLRKSMIVGRAASCELIFDDPALSRQHFALEVKEGRILIQNLSQGGFTTVNGVRLEEGAYALQPGDKIGAGQLRMTVRW